MIEMGIVAPIVVVGMLMWTQINQMTSTQHRLMASAYEGTKIVSQFTGLYLMDCMAEKDIEKKTMKICKAYISESECNAHFHGREGTGEGHGGTDGLTGDEKSRLFAALDQLLESRTLCQTMKERVNQAMVFWKLVLDSGEGSSGEGEPVIKPVHYCKDNTENPPYENCEKIPELTEVDEFVGIEVDYPKAYTLAHMFGVTKHHSKFVTYVRTYETPASGDVKGLEAMDCRGPAISSEKWCA